MDTILGISKTTLAFSSGALVLVLVGVLFFLAARKRILLAVGLRNITRRPLQSVLIILGLMLSTVLLTTSLGLADSVSSTIKTSELFQVGNLDEAVSKKVRHRIITFTAEGQQP